MMLNVLSQTPDIVNALREFYCEHEEGADKVPMYSKVKRTPNPCYATYFRCMSKFPDLSNTSKSPPLAFFLSLANFERSANNLPMVVAVKAHCRFQITMAWSGTRLFRSCSNHNYVV